MSIKRTCTVYKKNKTYIDSHIKFNSFHTCCTWQQRKQEFVRNSYTIMNKLRYKGFTQDHL